MDELAHAASRGDRKAFQELVSCLSRPLMAAAYRYTGDWEGARDLVQETWLRAWKHLASYDQTRPFRPWLLAIHRNVCLTFVRERARRREDMVDGEALERLAPPVAPDDGLGALEDRQFAARLQRALTSLSPAQREVFVRVDLEHGDQMIVARELGMQPTTLRTTLHFARQRLARCLAKDEVGQ